MALLARATGIWDDEHARIEAGLADADRLRSDLQVLSRPGNEP